MVKKENISCPLCGYSFTPENEKCFSSCPLGKNCQLLCCPQCHYRFPAESKVASLIKRLVTGVKEREKKR